MARAKGQDHFNAKESGSARSAKRRAVAINLGAKTLRRFLPGS
jgi:hypothetical protein